MEFVAKLDDQISEPAKEEAAALKSVGAAAGDASAKLKTLDAAQQQAARTAAAKAKAESAQAKALDVAQQRSARRAEAQAKAFNPEAYKQQIKAEQALGAAKEKALQEMGMGLSKKEQEGTKAAEKAKADAAKKAEQRDAAAAGGLRALGGAAKDAAIGFLAMAGASGLMKLGEIAVGYQGMARLQMITYRAGVNFRQLFRGVDSRPLERGLFRLTDLFNGMTPTGKAIGGLLTRGFNSFFSTLEKATPYVEGFAQGMVLAALYAENAWLKLRIALVPITSHLVTAADKSIYLRAAAYGGALAIGLLAAKAAVAGAPFIAFAAAVAPAVEALKQWDKLQQEGGLGEAWRLISQEHLGIGESDADRMNAKLDAEAAAKAAKQQEAQPPAAVRMHMAAEMSGEQASVKGGSAGLLAGQQIGQGLVDGMKSKEAAAEAAGAGLANAADRGVRAAAEIRSPARRFRRDAQYMGEGVVGGLRDSAPKVERAAEEALVPSLPAPGAPPAGGRGAGAAGPAVGVINIQLTLGAGANPGSLREELHEAAEKLAVMLRGEIVGAAA